jgi:thioredoxin-related protein
MGGASSKSTRKVDKMAVEAKVKAAITKNKVVVFSKTRCPYCIKAKEALTKFITDFTVIEVRVFSALRC